MRRIGSFEASVFYRGKFFFLYVRPLFFNHVTHFEENIANGDSNCADESHPDVLTFMKEDKRKTLVQNFQFLLLLFRSIGMNLVLVGEKKEGMEEINQSTQVPQIILHFHVKYSLATYLSLAEFCSEISLNNSYFASGMWLDLENDLHIKTNKLQYFGRKHDV